MKILSNKAYRELIAEKELTELSLKSLKGKYDFIVEENKKLHLTNDLLHIEIKSLSEKAEKYDIYLQKSKARKAKARAKVAASEPVEQATEMSEVEKFARENLGKEVVLSEKSSKYGYIGYVAGFSDIAKVYILIGFKNDSGWSTSLENLDITVLAEHKSYWWCKLDEIIFN